VQRLIGVRQLPRETVEPLHPYVRAKFDELWLTVHASPTTTERLDVSSVTPIVGTRRQPGDVIAAATPGGPWRRNSLQSMLSNPARSAVERASSSQTTNGRNFGLRRTNSPRPLRSPPEIRPVFTSSAQAPQLPRARRPLRTAPHASRSRSAPRSTRKRDRRSRPRRPSAPDPGFDGECLRVHDGHQGVVQRNELWGRRALARHARGVLGERSDQERVLEQGQVVGDRFEGTAILELPLDFLQ
jgi:hypothetical protein